jgi:hypothetical protein
VPVTADASVQKKDKKMTQSPTKPFVATNKKTLSKSKQTMDLTVQSVVWNPNGASFAALDRCQLVFVYPQPQFFDQNTIETERID